MVVQPKKSLYNQKRVCTIKKVVVQYDNWLYNDTTKYNYNVNDNVNDNVNMVSWERSAPTYPSPAGRLITGTGKVGKETAYK